MNKYLNRNSKKWSKIRFEFTPESIGIPFYYYRGSNVRTFQFLCFMWWKRSLN